MTLSDFRTQVTARLPATASWRFSEQNGLLAASSNQAWILYDPESKRWSVAINGDTYPLRARTLEDAHSSAAIRHRAAFFAARDLGLLPWATTQTPPAQGETETP
jgi:hypothetical protein